ncbi:hypothetical protein ACQEVF_32315 [Nonomuraea polychroma]|uniref:hypothetical protein n=1 Tax=Nonomuraea polychroma TaxID=46176 RepID=UPI003D917913
MTTDPFTTPAEAEREARVKQAHDMLAYAANAQHFYNPYMNDNLPAVVHERHAASVLYASQAATAHAMLAVRDELADIAGSLRTLAALPAAAQHLAEQVKDGLENVTNEMFDLRSDLEKASGPTDSAIRDVALTVHELTDAVLRLHEPQPRWWQRRRRKLRKQADDVLMWGVDLKTGPLAATRDDLEEADG